MSSLWSFRHRLYLVGAVVLSLLIMFAIATGTFAITAVTAPPRAMKGFVSDGVCTLPCWYGLTPGISTKDEVQHTLSELKFVDQTNIRETAHINGDEIVWWDSLGTASGRAFMRDGRLESLFLTADQRILLSAVFRKYGAPEKVYSYRYDSSDLYLFYANLFYPKYGLSLSLEFVPQGTPQKSDPPSKYIHEDMIVQTITLAPATTVEELLLNPYHVGGQYVVEQWQDWR